MVTCNLKLVKSCYYCKGRTFSQFVIAGGETAKAAASCTDHWYKIKENCLQLNLSEIITLCVEGLIKQWLKEMVSLNSYASSVLLSNQQHNRMMNTLVF